VWGKGGEKGRGRGKGGKSILWTRWEGGDEWDRKAVSEREGWGAKGGGGVGGSGEGGRRACVWVLEGGAGIGWRG